MYKSSSLPNNGQNHHIRRTTFCRAISNAGLLCLISLSQKMKQTIMFGDRHFAQNYNLKGER